MTAIYRWFYYMVPANPLLVRIVHGGSRRWQHFVIRAAYLGLLTLVMLFGLLTGGGLFGSQSLTQLAKSGTAVFAVVSRCQIGLICLLAPLFMAGAIAAEQSGKTFNILLTTPLSNMQIVLGSLMGRLYFVLALLASGLPLFAVLLIFGGVPVRSVFVSFGVAALSAIVTGSVAVTLAVLRAGGRKAVFVFVISIAGYLVACYMVDAFLLRGVAPRIPDSITWLTPLHPLLVLEASLNGTHYRVPPPELIAGYPAPLRFYLGNPFEAFAAITGGVSLLLIGWSAIRLRAVGQGDGGLITGSRLGRWLRLGQSSERRHAPREVWANPVAWREANTRGNRAAAIVGRWGFLVVSLIACGTILCFYHTRQITADVFEAALFTMLLVEVAVIILVAIYMSAGSVSREREDGTLDLLLTTPITPLKYLWGKLRGLVSFLLLLVAGPVFTVGMVSVYTIIGQLRHWPQVVITRNAGAVMVSDAELMFPESPLLMALVLVPFVACCAVVGMSCSLSSKRVLRALVLTVPITGLILVGYRLLRRWHGPDDPAPGPGRRLARPHQRADDDPRPVDQRQPIRRQPPLRPREPAHRRHHRGGHLLTHHLLDAHEHGETVRPERAKADGDGVSGKKRKEGKRHEA